MERERRKAFRVVAAFDTETSTVGKDDAARAFAYVYIVNDLREVDIADYTPGDSDDIRLYRTLDEYVGYVQSLIEWGITNETVPVVAAYNLMFDLQTVLNAHAFRYGCAVVAQSSTTAYTFDLLAADGSIILRYWDTWHLELNGLAAMGETAGLPKAVGDLDYSLVRTSATPLTPLEEHYCRRDVQVIPAYLSYLLHAYDWMESGDLGCHVLTKSSIVRQMARRTIGPLEVRGSGGRTYTLAQLFEILCRQELPTDFYTYALRRACFRGGFTFTAAANCSRVVRNVCSLDVTSMHHTFINGRMLPVKFRRADTDVLTAYARRILATPRARVLHNYHEPLTVGLHVLVQFKNLRLRRGSAFEHYGIALLASGKFDRHAAPLEFGGSELTRAADEDLIGRGWRDTADGVTYAFGKVYAADVAQVFVNEIELWCIGRVYDFDSMEVLAGEMARNFVRPPDYVTLQSNILFETKNDAKFINNNYEEGIPYPYDIPSTIPDGIASELRAGTCSAGFFQAYYQSGVKGSFNGIYGVQAQNVYKPDYAVDDEGDLYVDHETLATPENFTDKQPKHPSVLYNYGARIVAGSRMHLIIAIELLYERFGSRVEVTGGDTDSIKAALAPDVTGDELLSALSPLHDAATNALALVQARVRDAFPQLASQLTGIGTFDLEPASRGKLCYDEHYEAWNKARVSVVDGRSHITAAGLPRPADLYNVENLLDDLMAKGHTFEELAPLVLGYNTTFDPSICHTLQRLRPAAYERFSERVTDYLGDVREVDQPAAMALYPCERRIGEILKFDNLCNVDYLASKGIEVDRRPKYIGVDYDESGEAHPYIRVGGAEPYTID